MMVSFPCKKKPKPKQTDRIISKWGQMENADFFLKEGYSFNATSTKKRPTLVANIITTNDTSQWVVYPPNAKSFIDLFLARVFKSQIQCS